MSFSTSRQSPKTGKKKQRSFFSLFERGETKVVSVQSIQKEDESIDYVNNLEKLYTLAKNLPFLELVKLARDLTSNLYSLHLNHAPYDISVLNSENDILVTFNQDNEQIEININEKSISNVRLPSSKQKFGLNNDVAILCFFIRKILNDNLPEHLHDHKVLHKLVINFLDTLSIENSQFRPDIANIHKFLNTLIVILLSKARKSEFGDEHIAILALSANNCYSAELEAQYFADDQETLVHVILKLHQYNLLCAEILNLILTDKYVLEYLSFLMTKKEYHQFIFHLLTSTNNFNVDLSLENAYKIILKMIDATQTKTESENLLKNLKENENSLDYLSKSSLSLFSNDSLPTEKWLFLLEHNEKKIQTVSETDKAESSLSSNIQLNR